MTNQHLEIAVENAAKDLIDHYLVFELCHNDIAKYAAATNCTVEQAQRKVDLGRKLQEIEKDRVAKEAFDRGYEGASPDMPSKYSASFSDLWEDNWNAGMMDARHDRYDALTDAREHDATGQDQWKQDRV